MMWLTIGPIFCFLIIFVDGQGGMEWQQCGRWNACRSQFACCRCWSNKCLQDSDCGWFNKCFEYHCSYHHIAKNNKKRSLCADDNCSVNPVQIRPKRWSGSSCDCACVPKPPLADQCAPILPQCYGDAECQGNHACIAGGCAPLNPHNYG